MVDYSLTRLVTALLSTCLMHYPIACVIHSQPLEGILSFFLLEQVTQS